MFFLFLSHDDKAKVPIGLPISKKQSLMLMQLYYKENSLTMVFPSGKNHKLILLSMPAVYQTKTEGFVTVDPCYVAVRSTVQSTIKVQLKVTWMSSRRS